MGSFTSWFAAEPCLATAVEVLHSGQSGRLVWQAPALQLPGRGYAGMQDPCETPGCTLAQMSPEAHLKLQLEPR